MNSRAVFAVFLSVGLLAGGCATAGVPEIALTPMADREAQTRHYDAIAPAAALKILLDTLQDGRFTIEQTDSALGMIQASRSITTEASGLEKALKWSTIAMTYGLAAILPWTKHQTNQLHVVAHISAEGSGTRVRLTFERRRFDGQGRLKGIEPVSEAAAYGGLFELFERSAFVAATQQN